MCIGGSVTRWIEEFKAGYDDATAPQWEQIFRKLVRIARQKFETYGIPRRVFDEEDVAISALERLRQLRDGEELREITTRNNLWPLLLLILRGKLFDRVRHETAIKRGGGEVRGNSAVVGKDRDDDGAGFDEIEVQPDDTSEVLGELLDRLDPDTRAVLVYRLQEYTIREIAEKLGMGPASVHRALDLVRYVWMREFADG